MTIIHVKRQTEGNQGCVCIADIKMERLTNSFSITLKQIGFVLRSRVSVFLPRRRGRKTTDV